MYPDASRRSRGASAVEFALVLPILLLLVFGIMEFGFAFFRQATLAGAAREAVREYAINSIEADARARAITHAPFGLVDADVVIEVDGVPVSLTVKCSETTDTATVTITKHFDSLTGFIPGGFTLTGRGTMRCGA